MEEENFPRGGIKKVEGKKHKKEYSLFQSPPDDVEKKKASKRKRKGGKNDAGPEVKKKHKMEGQVSGQVGQEQPQHLTKKLLYPGMMMLGYVRQIKNYAVMIALPNGLSGVVPITNISQAYSESLQRFSEGQNQNAEGICTLAELFQVGMIVPCKLTELEKSAENNMLTLTINPKDVNSDLSSASLRHGMCVYGSISSEEDHGYIVDIGVKGVQAFLKKKYAARYIQLYNNDNALHVGQYLMCKIQLKGDRMSVLTGQNRVINVSIDPLELKNIESPEDSEIPFTSVVPGMKMHAKVEKVVKNEGLIIQFNKFRGLIHKSHLPRQPDKYNHGDQITGSVLFIHPLIKTVTLTALPHLVDYVGIPLGIFGELKVGDTIEEAIVKRTEKKRGVFLNLQNGVTGIATMYNLSDDTVENLGTTFKKDSVHRCRVLGFWPMEALVIVTMKQSVLNEKYTTISDIQPGEIVDVKVKKMEKKGIRVELYRGVNGWIPNNQLADVTLQHPEHKFKVDDKLKCRVLSVNKKDSSVILTHKKSLLTSKYPVISSFNMLEVGQILEGYISAIEKCGCFVRFYNNVMGLAPRSLLSSEPIERPEDVFYKGQVVRCKVVDVTPANKKFKLSFVLEGKTEFGKKGKDLPKDFQIGKKEKCKILTKTEDGLDVKLSSSQKKAFIPKTHLSDSIELCDALWDVYKPGDVIEKAMYWNKSRYAILTCKPCLLSSAENKDEFVTSFAPLKPGIMLPGVVKNIMPYGIFVEFPGGLFGLVPLQYALDVKVPDVKTFYQPGQTVVAKIIEVNSEKKRFLASLRMQDCYYGNTQVGLDLTWNYLKERERLFESLQNSEEKGNLAQIKIGSIHKVTVIKMTRIGAVCELKNGIKAIVTSDNINEKQKVGVGKTFDSVVLYVDLKQNCVEVSIDTKIVPHVKERIESEDMEKAKLGEVYQSWVVLIKEDFVIVRLTNQARGQLAFLPAKRHWNDVLERHQYNVGQKNKVQIKRIEGDMILASLKVHEDKELEDEEKISYIPTHKLQIGDRFDATVRKMYKDQIYINVCGTYGRVFVTEMSDEVVDGSCPPLRMQKREHVKVRIIGFRDHKSKAYLPISHPKTKNAMPDCSMKPSVLALDKLPDDYICSGDKYSIGEKVVASVITFSNGYLHTKISPRVRGRVYLLNLSTSLEMLRNPTKHFKNGQVYNATVIQKVSSGEVELSFLEAPLKELCPGVEVRAVVFCVTKSFGMVVRLTDNIRGTLDITDMSDNYENLPLQGYKKGDIVTVRILKVDKFNKQAVVTMRPDETNNKPVDRRIERMADLKIGEFIRGYVVAVANKGITVRLGVKMTVVLPPDCIVKGKYVNLDLMKENFEIDSVIKLKFLGFDDRNTAKWSVHHDTDFPEECLSDRPFSNEPFSNEISRNRSISNSSADSEATKSKRTKLKNMETASDIDETIELEIGGLERMDDGNLDERDSVTNSSVVSEATTSLSDCLEGKINKDWDSLNRSVSDSDFSIDASDDDDDNDVEDKEEGDDENVIDSESKDNNKNTGKNKRTRKKSRSENMLEETKTTVNASETIGDDNAKLDIVEDSDTEANLQIKERLTRKLSEKAKEIQNEGSSVDKSTRKRKVRGDRKQSGSESESTRSKVKKVEDSDSEDDVKIVTKSDLQVSEKPVLDLGQGFSWDTEFKLPSQKQEDISSDDSADEDSQKQVKKSKEQIREEKIEEEKRIYRVKMQRLEGEIQPETADDFDRLVLQSPNSSLVWLRYMAFHLETTEIDKARAVAERALKTISFREEQEKLNVWVAYLNLENMYGTSTTVTKVLTRAAQQNDQITVYLQMITIYVKSGKNEDAEQLFNTLVKKHSGNKDVWIKFGEFYFQQGRLESARKLLQRCLKSLEMRQHVDVIVKFAQMEFKHGEPERGKTMFENTLSTYPKRTDLWSVYIDMVTKIGEFDSARSIYNRVIEHKMAAKKMKFFFKKYLQFEERYGSEDNVAEVKRKALQYVESQGFVDE
ncbi:protein RRP5 homolog [Ruditapes philippinarum]|uniref:protein RRP5 homolog n=1 Tax=Ruditapes philippinarum TaxID=129788 RepID=UPI00295BDFEA|nr:protein RRP5 homolog [Ruditapes philippinarum]